MQEIEISPMSPEARAALLERLIDPGSEVGPPAGPTTVRPAASA